MDRARSPGARPIGFAHRGGAERRADHNSHDAFSRALAMGATGIESDVWLTADGVPVFHHALPWRGARLRSARYRDLPSGTVTLETLYERCGVDFELALDMPDPSAASRVVEIAEAYSAADRLWLTYWKLHTLATWRQRWPDIRLVMPAIILPRHVPHRRIAALRDASVDVLNLHHLGVDRRAVAAAHDAGVEVFA